MCRGIGRWGPRHILGLLGVLVGAVWVGVLTGDDQGMLRGHPGPQVHSLHPWQGQSQMHVTCKRIQHHMVLMKQNQSSYPARLVMIDRMLRDVAERHTAIMISDHILMHGTSLWHEQELQILCVWHTP